MQMDNDNERSRIQASVTPAELHEFRLLARSCNTSISGLAQVAIRGLMVQARAGAIPMVPKSQPLSLNSVQLAEAGLPVSGEVLAAEYDEAVLRDRT